MPDNHDLATANRKGLLTKLSGSASDALLGTGVFGDIDLAAGVTGTLPPSRGGTGQSNNDASVIIISGAFNLTMTLSAATGVTLPTSGTLATLAGAETLTNKALNGTLGATTPASAVVTTLSISEGAIIAGTFTPTLTNTTNIAASTVGSCHYMRVGSTVHTSGRLTIDPTATGACLLGISLPVASNLAANSGLAGVANCTLIPGQNGIVEGDSGNDRASLRFTATDTDNREWFFMFTYTVF